MPGMQEATLVAISTWGGGRRRTGAHMCRQGYRQADAGLDRVAGMSH
jgi:hypothetical protein